MEFCWFKEVADVGLVIFPDGVWGTFTNVAYPPSALPGISPTGGEIDSW
jgi:hypothetical protein